MPGEADWFVETWLVSCFFFGSHSLTLPYSGARSNGRLMAGSHSFPFSEGMPWPGSTTGAGQYSLVFRGRSEKLSAWTGLDLGRAEPFKT